MRYVFSKQLNIFAVVSTTNPARLKQNSEATLLPFGEEDVNTLENDQ